MFFEIEQTGVRSFRDGCSRLFDSNRTARAKMRRRRDSTGAAAARCRMRPKSGRCKLCATIALPIHFRDPRSKKIEEDARSFSRGVADAGTCAGNSDGEDRKRYWGTDWSYLAKYQALRASGERVEIDGTCASACTM